MDAMLVVVYNLAGSRSLRGYYTLDVDAIGFAPNDGAEAIGFLALWCDRALRTAGSALPQPRYSAWRSIFSDMGRRKIRLGAIPEDTYQWKWYKDGKTRLEPWELVEVFVDAGSPLRNFYAVKLERAEPSKLKRVYRVRMIDAHGPRLVSASVGFAETPPTGCPERFYWVAVDAGTIHTVPYPLGGGSNRVKRVVRSMLRETVELDADARRLVREVYVIG